jgi:hypothetical protein
VTLGDENSTLFHSTASSQKSKNHIATITDTFGAHVSDHNSKATLLLQAYKESLGQTENTASISPFAHLLHNDIDLAF